MRVHWYWPFAREEELELAHGALHPGDSIVAEVIDRQPAPSEGTTGGVTIVRDLPEVLRDVGSIRWIPSRTRTYWARERARRRYWSNPEFDLFHLHYVNRFIDGIVPFPDRPVVMSVHDVIPHQLRLGSTIEHRLLARLYRRPTALIVHHRSLADELINRFGAEPAKIHVVPHQVFPVPQRYQRQRPNDARTILFFGSLRQNKGLPVLLDAFARMHHKDLHLVIAGRGDTELEHLALAAASRDPRITAKIGFVPLSEKRELFASAWIVALPYTAFSSQSGVLHDAYGHGRPVVASNVGALGHSVREDQTGLVVPPDDRDALEDAVLHLLDQEKWERAATNAAEMADARSPDRVGTQLRSVYDQLMPM